MMMTILPALLLVAAVPSINDIGFGGAPPLGPKDSLRHLLRPYDLVKLNVLGATYCENLLDCRVNTTSYSHLNSDAPWGDGYNLQFPDDAARFLECVAWEDQYSPIVRLELARRLVKGLLAAHVPGSFSDSFFRHRSGGKTFLIAGDKPGTQGRLALTMWGDELSGSLKVGFRLRKGGLWLGMDTFTFADPPDSLLEPWKARADRWWHASPITVPREFASNAADVVFTGRYWLSDEDKPLEYAFKADAGDGVEITIGEPGCPMPLMGDYRLPTTIHLPDRRTAYRSDADGDRVFNRPDFRYLILRKTGGAFAATGYSTALLVMWDGKPDRVEVLADKGYGEVRVQYAGRQGRVWLNPYYWLDESDIGLVHASAERFLAHGTLPQNGFPTQQMLNAAPAGLAAGAYLLTRYRDPLAETARIRAARAVDRLFAAEDEGKTLVRAFFPVRAAAWMVKAAHELGDAAMQERYAGLLDRAVKRMCSAALGYDGKAWAGGWDHFNSMKALALAHDATGKAEYGAAFERALSVYTIDEHGIYRYGQKMDAPGGFDTYSGSLPLAVWGCAGKLEWADTLINLAVPNGWHEPQRLVRDTWNDAGAGPWAQDDANPEFLGLSLKGAALPTTPKRIVPVGAFPSYDASGKVEPINPPILRNPFFLPSASAETTSSAASVQSIALPVPKAGKSAVRRIDLTGANGAALDLRIKGDGYMVEVSPDRKRWFARLDTYDPAMADQSLDLSFLCGSHEELIRLFTVAPPGDAARLVSRGSTLRPSEQRRFAPPGGALAYRLRLPNVVVCRLEMILGNGYRVDLSSDGKRWRRAASDEDPDGGSGKPAPDAAMIRMVDATPELRKSPDLYVRISDAGNTSAYEGRPAFVRRIAVYGAMKCREAWVRISPAAGSAESLQIERMTLRRW